MHFKIQDLLGFVIANISSLDKKQYSFKAVTTPTAVKQDLVISAYKPNDGFDKRFQKEAQTEEDVWTIIEKHLQGLPITRSKDNEHGSFNKREPRILFDHMVTWFMKHGQPVPLSSKEFRAGLAQRFVLRDGMIFLQHQIAEYDERRIDNGT